MKYTSLLVTGGCGFIGSNFVRRILAQNSVRVVNPTHVVNLDKLTYAGNRANLTDVENNPFYTFVHGDICDSDTVRNILREHAIDCIVNFAAETHVDRSITDAAPFLATNIMGVHVLLDAAREFGVKRFLQISTDEVYGSQSEGVVADESAPLRCGSPYSASKASADLLCLAYWNTYRFPVVISRCANNYGPYQHPEKLIPLTISRAFTAKHIPVYGDGLHRRDWLYVEDHCEALQYILDIGSDGEVYNIGSGIRQTNLETVRTLLATANAPESLIRNVPDRPGHDRMYAIDVTKLNTLGWRARHSFKDGIAATIAWYRAHEDWLREILGGEYAAYFADQYSGIEL